MLQNEIREQKNKVNLIVTKLSSKAKGRLVQSLIRPVGRLSMHGAFLRWKLKVDPQIMKNAIDQILYNSRLNAFNAFYKLKFLLGQKSTDSCNLEKEQQNYIYYLLEEKIRWQNKQDELVRYLKEWEEMFRDSYKNWKETQAKLNLLQERYLKDEEHKAKNNYFLMIQKTQIGKLQSAFFIWRQLPEISKVEEACIFEKKLTRLIRKPLLQSFNQFSDLYQQGLNTKKRMIRLLVKSKVQQQQSIIKKWNNSVKFLKEQDRSRTLIKVISNLCLILHNNLKDLKSDSVISWKKKLAISLFYQHKLNQLNVAFVQWRHINQINCHKTENTFNRQERLKKEAIQLFCNYGTSKLRLYFIQWKVKAVKRNMIQIFNSIQKMLHLNRFAERAIKKFVIDKWRGPKAKNKWLRRVVEMIAKNSRVNSQVAYWRMRDSAVSQKALGMSTQKIIKCKKLFNNLAKAFDRTRQRAFTNIEHFGTGINDTSSYEPSSSSFLQQTPIKCQKSQIDTIFQLSQLDTQQQIIDKQQIVIDNLKKKLDWIRLEKLLKSLTNFQDHLVEDSFLALEQK